MDDRSSAPAWVSHAPGNRHLVWKRQATVVVGNQNCALCFANVRHERIHTKRGSCVMMPPQEEDADDLAALEALDEVGGGGTTRELAIARANLPAASELVPTPAANTHVRC